MNLPPKLQVHLKSLFEQHPLEAAMSQLRGASPILTNEVRAILQAGVVAGDSTLAAGLWLYVDDLDRCHEICQDLPDSLGACWHGIMHRREGDYSNSHYWMNRAERNPLPEHLSGSALHELVDAVSRSRSMTDEQLIARQRAEWQHLFEYYANQPG